MKKIISLTTLLLSSTGLAAVSNGQKFDTWTAVCEKGQCAVVQVQNTKDGVPVGRVFIHKPKQTKNRPVMVFTVPLGVNLHAQLGIAVDTKQIARVPFDFCNQDGCSVAIPLEGQIMQKIRAGKNMQVAAFVADKQQTLVFSLKGISKAIDSL